MTSQHGLSFSLVNALGLSFPPYFAPTPYSRTFPQITSDYLILPSSSGPRPKGQTSSLSPTSLLPNPYAGSIGLFQMYPTSDHTSQSPCATLAKASFVTGTADNDSPLTGLARLFPNGHSPKAVALAPESMCFNYSCAFKPVLLPGSLFPQV